MASKGKRTAEEAIKIAKSFLGYKEKASNYQLDSFTANSGSANYTKFAKELNEAGYYNGNKNGYAWCDVFVDYVFYILCEKNKKEAEAMEFQTGLLGAGCEFSAQYYKNAGRFDKEPKVGDQIFFASAGEHFAHTGIVTYVGPSAIATIEGNHGNRVDTWTYDRYSTLIDGFGHPMYDTITDDISVNSEDYELKMRVLKEGCSGRDVYALQSFLYCTKYYPEKPDGEYGPITKSSVISYQKAMFPKEPSQWDGEAGPITMGTIFKY